MTNEWLKEEISQAIEALGLDLGKNEFKLEHPTDLALGDFSTNVAMVLAKGNNQNPQELAEKIKNKILETLDSRIKEIQIAGPGFINFFLAEEFFAESIKEILVKPKTFGQTDLLAGQKVMVEYTDPNPFKEFHIGHLMSNTVGEAVSRLIEANGAEVKRACYQGDVGLHVAKTLWGIFKLENELPKVEATLTEKVRFLGRAYTLGATEYESGSENAKEGITIINKKIYKRSDSKLNELYDQGRQWSLDYFETIYQKLGTDFDYYFFESEMGGVGQKLVEEGLTKRIFTKSDGAVVFCGEKFDPHLHTRVFLNAEGLPTYEAKELGLAKIKAGKYPASIFVSVTGNEINEYFKVVLRAMQELMPEIADKIKHLSHGMLRLLSGKMSSRTGQVITAEALIEDVKAKVLEKIKDRELDEKERAEISEKVAIGAIKYSILKQGIGKDIIFDFDKSLSFEGDSGPYLQYAYTRALSVLKKAETKSLEAELPNSTSNQPLAHLLYQLPEITKLAYRELAPQYLVSYLIEVAGAFNSFYTQNKIIGSSNEADLLVLTLATSIVLKNGLNILGIPVLEKM
ncbi:MAG: arginine--tRNA ligase [Candidatus Paceibacterota bacterium]|jgi:arginyl-tRNA synthetase